MDYRGGNDPYAQENQDGYVYQTGGWNSNPGHLLATASMLLGVAAVFVLFTVFFPFVFVFGSLAIILALLSKGYGRRLLTAAKVGMISGGCGLLVISLIVGGLTAFFLLSSREDLVQMGQQLDQQFESQTGIPAEDILGESYEELMNDFVDMRGR